jgi:YggT family protein
VLGFGGGCVPDGTTGSETVCLLFQILTLAIIARALLSWFQLDPRSPVVQMLSAITDPIIDPIRQIMPRIGMIDFSPLVALLAIQILISPLLQTLLINAGI